MLNELRRTINDRCRVYLLRHGSVSYFDADGQPHKPDDVPLTREGLAQAQAVGEALREIKLDRVITSGLPRTRQTAAFLLEGRDLEEQICPELREIEAGRLADIPRESFEQTLIGALAKGLGPDTRFLGGETFGSLETRVLGAFSELLEERLREKGGWRQIAVVAHGGTNRVLLCHALGSGLKHLGALEQDPACLNIIDIDPDGSFLVRLVNHSHYDPAKRELRLKTMEKIFFDYVMPRAAELGLSGGNRPWNED